MLGSLADIKYVRLVFTPLHKTAPTLLAFHNVSKCLWKTLPLCNQRYVRQAIITGAGERKHIDIHV